MATFENAKAVTKNTRNFLFWPARKAELHEQERILNLPQLNLKASGGTRFLTFGDAAVRQFQVLPAVIANFIAIIEKNKEDKKVLRFFSFCRSKGI
jgi:hypothetical protein